MHGANRQSMDFFKINMTSLSFLYFGFLLGLMLWRRRSHFTKCMRCFSLCSLFYAQCAFLAVGCQRERLAESDLARINGQPISEKEFLTSYELTPHPYLKKSANVDERKTTHLNWMIDRKLLAAEAVRRGFDRDPKVQALLEYYRNKEALKQLYREVVQNQINITEKEMRRAYMQLNETLRAQHLFSKNEAEAWRMYERLQTGASFEEIARATFSDANLAESGGDLGEFTWGDMDPDFEEAAFQLQPGEISPPVRTKWGYHIIKVTSRVRNPLLTEAGYQSRKSYIRKLIQRRKEAQAARAFISDFMTPKNVKMKGPAFSLLASYLVEPKNDAPKFIPKPLDAEIQQALFNIAEHLHDTLVEFDGGSWTIADFLSKLSQMPLPDRPNTQSRTSLKNGIGIMVRDEFLAKEARRRGLHTAPKVTEEFERIKEELLSLKCREEIEKAITVSEEEIAGYFERHREKYDVPAQVNIREVLVRTKEEAEKIKRAIEQGQDIAALAKQHSIRKWAAARGGEFGYFSKGMYGAIGEQAFAGMEGEICGPLEISGLPAQAGGPPHGGYSVFKIIDRKPARRVSLPEVKEQIRAELLVHKKERAVAAVTSELRARTEIVIDERKLAALTVTDDWAQQPISLFTFSK